MYNYPPGCDVCEQGYLAALRRNANRRERLKIERPAYTMSFVDRLGPDHPSAPGEWFLGLERWRCSRCQTVTTARLIIVTDIEALDPNPRLTWPDWPDSMSQDPPPARPRSVGPRSGWVYFIGAESGEGPIKIGFSARPQERLNQLQTGSGHRLVIIGTFEASEEVEIELHSQFAEHRLHGEWFARVPLLEELIRDRCGGG